MLQRQRPPYQGGMGFPRGMTSNPFMNQMPGYPPVLGNGGFPPQQARGNPMMRNGRFPQMGAPGQAQMRQGGGGGGLLSRLFSRGNPAAGVSRAVNPASLAAPTGEASGGLLSALTNPASVNGFLTNTQKMLNTASQFGPMINQYGPMVKNIPAMWKMYRGMKDSSESSNSEEKIQKTENQTKRQKTTETLKKQDTNSNHTTPASKEKVERQKGLSKPKLYI